jgi:hypothetical protein
MGTTNKEETLFGLINTGSHIATDDAGRETALERAQANDLECASDKFRSVVPESLRDGPARNK